MERFVDLFMKMDDLHLSDFRETRLKSKGDFDSAYSAVMGVGLDVYLQKLRGDLCKSGPGHFASEKSFPSNFAL